MQQQVLGKCYQEGEKEVGYDECAEDAVKLIPEFKWFVLLEKEKAGKEEEQCQGIFHIDGVVYDGSIDGIYFGVEEQDGQHGKTPQQVDPFDASQFMMAILHTVPFFPS